MRRIKRVSFVALLLLVMAAFIVSIVYAGSPGTLARGIRVDGVDIGGLSQTEATSMLADRGRTALAKPVRFVVAGHAFNLKAADIDLRPDWAAAVAAARHAGDGFGPLRGIRRMKLRFGGENLGAKVSYDQEKLDAAVSRIAGKVDRPHREASIVLHGLTPAVVAAHAGRVLDRDAAGRSIVAALSSLGRGNKVALSLKVDAPKVTARRLATALARTRIAVSAPVVLTLGETRYRVPRWRIATILNLPADGATHLKIAGPGADAYFRQLHKAVDAPAHDAQFTVVSGGIVVKPSIDARVLEVPKTADALLKAAIHRANRSAPIAVTTQPAKRTTKDAKAMGITGLVSSYTTTYGGVPNRIHNVEVVSHLIDNTLIAPGKEFSFNGTTGERNAAKGFLDAPVIINGELQNGLGGGVCQVSTTVFNAAYEAGLPITERVNHALYISHYPQGRDATVNYPDVDLKFVNDTGHWLLLRTFVSAYSLTVNLYGTPQHRRVVSSVAPLVTAGPVPTQTIKDPKLLKGKKVVEQTGSAPLSTSVTRKVYDSKGKLLYENTWYSRYQGEKQIVRVGTKPKPKPKPKVIPPSVYLPIGPVPAVVAPDTTAQATTTTATG